MRSPPSLWLDESIYSDNNNNNNNIIIIIIVVVVAIVVVVVDLPAWACLHP